jgi:prepilin-type N-terminal cleavage/methylation domain-containing protein
MPRETAASAFPQNEDIVMIGNHSTTRWRVAAPSHDKGLTLIELVIVLTILVALGGLIVPIFGNLGQQAREEATKATLARVAEAIDGPGGYGETMRYARDPGGADGADDLIGEGSGLPWPSDADIAGGRVNHPQLAFLFKEPTGLAAYDPVSRIGWRGDWLSTTTATPYQIEGTFTDTFGEEGAVPADLAPIDGWGNPVVIQLPDSSTGTLEQRVQAVRLISAGPNGEIETPANVLTPDISNSAVVGDDVVLYLRRENP